MLVEGSVEGRARRTGIQRGVSLFLKGSRINRMGSDTASDFAYVM